MSDDFSGGAGIAHAWMTERKEEVLPADPSCLSLHAVSRQSLSPVAGRQILRCFARL